MPRDDAGAIGQTGWRPTEVHPLADLFPMMEPDDLKALAEDIKANGLQQPVVIDRVGRLIDGRNRLAACEQAGVEPEWRMIKAADAEAFIWGVNVKRRQMTKGQIAMIAAVGFIASTCDKSSERAKRGRPDQGRQDAAKTLGLTTETLRKAFLIRDHAPDLVPAIIAGKLFLDPAYATAQARKKEADWQDDGLRLLRKQDPDLARRVTDGELTLEAARKLLDERAKAEASSRQAVLLDILGMTRSAIGFRDSETLRRVPDWLASEDGVRDHLRYFEGGPAEILERIEEARAGLDAVAAVYSTIKAKASEHG